MKKSYGCSSLLSSWAWPRSPHRSPNPPRPPKPAWAASWPRPSAPPRPNPPPSRPLSSLDALETEGLPTERFVERMVECAFRKGASAERLRARAEGAVEDTRAARLLVDGMKARRG